MTHSILLIIELENYEDVEEIRNRINADEQDDEGSNLVMYQLMNTPKTEIYPDMYPKTKYPPFIVFPKKNERDEESGKYQIIIESGSHCAWNDTSESFFMWVFWYYFLEEIESYGIDVEYRITEDGEDNKYNLRDALQLILRESTELSKFIQIKK